MSNPIMRNLNPIVIVDIQANLSRYVNSPMGTIFSSSDTEQTYIRSPSIFGIQGANTFVPLRPAQSIFIINAGANPTLTASTLPDLALITPANAVTLPATTQVPRALATFYRTGAAGAVTIVPAGGNTIDGGGTVTLANDGNPHAITLCAVGTDWKTTSKY